jgi:uncharacterized protein
LTAVEGMNRDQFESIKKYSEQQMAKLGLWGWPHVVRVHHLCLRLADALNEGRVDTDVLEAAALLHDVAKHVQKRKPLIDHGRIGAEMAERYLKKCGFERKKIDAVTHIIRSHTRSEEPNSIEAKIFHDADFLDKLGAVGIATVFIKACLSSNTIEETLKTFQSDQEKKLEVAKHVGWLKRPHLYTEIAQKISEKRNQIVTSFFDELERELETSDL